MRYLVSVLVNGEEQVQIVDADSELDAQHAVLNDFRNSFIIQQVIPWEEWFLDEQRTSRSG